MRNAEAGSAGLAQGECLGSGVRPGWPNVRLVANDGRSREVCLIVEIGPTGFWQDRVRLPWFFPRRAGRCVVSVLIKPEKMNSSVLDGVSPNRVSGAEEATLSHNMRPLRREYEPPEEAFEDGEAPERSIQVRVEAPDAGEPQFLYDDREFRHGRSRG